MSDKERLEYLEETKFDLECEIHRLDLKIKELKEKRAKNGGEE